MGADKTILSNELEIAAVLEHRARYAVFANNDMTGRAQAERFVACLGELREAAGREGPWNLKITGSGLVEVGVEQLREPLARRGQRDRLPRPRRPPGPFESRTRTVSVPVATSTRLPPRLPL